MIINNVALEQSKRDTPHTMHILLVHEFANAKKEYFQAVFQYRKQSYTILKAAGKDRYFLLVCIKVS